MDDIMRKEGVILLVLGMLLLASCKSNTNTGDFSAHTGTQGLLMEFVTNQPPSKLYEGEPVDVMVEVRNKGAYPQSDSGYRFEGMMFITGFDPTYIQMDTPQPLDSDLFGKDQYNTEGGYTLMKFTGAPAILPTGTDTYKITLLATACYRYQTLASATVCIDPKPYARTFSQKVCSIHDVSLSGGQGGPVAVSAVEEEVTTNSIKFRITVKNVGGGRVVDYTRWNTECPDFEYQSLDYVDVQAMLSGAMLSCRPQNPIKLIDGTASVICDAAKPPDEVDAYTTPLQVYIDYGYSDSITRSLEIAKG